MRKLSRVASTDVRSSDPVLGEVDVHEFVHISHDEHVCVEENDALGQSVSDENTGGREERRTSYSVSSKTLQACCQSVAAARLGCEARTSV